MAIENFVSVEHTEGPQLAAALERHIKAHEVDVWERQRATGLVPATEPGGLHTVELASGATAAGPHRRPRLRCPLAADGRARRSRAPQQGRHLLPPLRRPAVQGQASRGDRRRQLRRRGGHRPRRPRRRMSRSSSSTTSSGPTPCCSGPRRSAQHRGVAQRPHHRGARRRLEGRWASPTRTARPASTGEVDLDGVFVQIGLLPNTEWLEGAVERSPRGEIEIDDAGRDLGARRVRRRRLHHRRRSSRSSWPWAPARPPPSAPSTT